MTWEQTVDGYRDIVGAHHEVELPSTLAGARGDAAG